MPGAAVETTSITPDAASRLATRPKPCSRRYSSSARGADRARSGRSPTSWASVGLPSSSTASTRQPGVGGRTGEKRRYRGLADSPLPGDDGDPRRGEQRHDVHGLRRHLCADYRSACWPRPPASACSASPAGAGDGDGGEANADAEPGRVDVLLVSGLFDPIVVDAIENAIDDAVAADAQALIIQVNSRGAVVGDERHGGVARHVADPRCRSPCGSARPAPGCTAHRRSCSPSPTSPGWHRARASATPASCSTRPASRSTSATPPTRLRDGSVGLSDARELGVLRQRVSDEGIPTLTSMVNALDGYAEGGRVVRTTEDELTDDGTVRRTTIAPVRQSSLPFVDRLFHTVASPAITYLLLLLGLALLVFEFYTAGRRHRRRGRCRRPRAGVQRACGPPGAGLGGRIDHRLDVRLRRRRPGRHPPLLDGGGDRRHGRRQLLAVRTAARGDAATVVDHLARRHRRRRVGLRGRDAVDGANRASPLRRSVASGCSASSAKWSSPSIPMGSSRSAREPGGRARTGQRRCRPDHRCGSSPSMGSRSRSSRSRGRRVTTVTGADRPTTRPPTTPNNAFPGSEPFVNTVVPSLRRLLPFLPFAAW